MGREKESALRRMSKEGKGRVRSKEGSKKDDPQNLNHGKEKGKMRRRRREGERCLEKEKMM